jgi:plasmid stabilization system protein ParE
MAKVRWSTEADTWLKDIYDYIAADNPRAAASVVDGIYEKAQALKKFPDIGYVYRSEEEGEIRILLYRTSTPSRFSAMLRVLSPMTELRNSHQSSMPGAGVFRAVVSLCLPLPG